MQDHSLHSLTLLQAQGVIVQWKTQLACVTTWVQSLDTTGENTAAQTKTDECAHFLSLGLSLQVQFKTQETLEKCYIQFIKEVKGSVTGVTFL